MLIGRVSLPPVSNVDTGSMPLPGSALPIEGINISSGIVGVVPPAPPPVVLR